MVNAPIALFAFNRPDKFEKCLDSLSRNFGACDSDLFIFIDGPRQVADIPNIKKVKQIANHASGFKSVSIQLKDTNLGLAKSVRSGISTIFEEYNSVIVLEDDLILSKSFLNFMNAGLLKYETEIKVASIQGFQYPVQPAPREIVTIRGADCWGWATWKDRWKSTIFDPNKLLAELKDQSLEFKFDLDDSANYVSMLRDLKEGMIDSWAICWHASMYLQDRISIHPRESLIYNDGNDGKGTHGNRSRMFDTELGSWSENEDWPRLEENLEYRKALISFYRQNFGTTPSSIWRTGSRIKHLLKNFLPTTNA